MEIVVTIIIIIIIIIMLIIIGPERGFVIKLGQYLKMDVQGVRKIKILNSEGAKEKAKLKGICIMPA